MKILQQQKEIDVLKGCQTQETSTSRLLESPAPPDESRVEDLKQKIVELEKELMELRLSAKQELSIPVSESEKNTSSSSEMVNEELISSKFLMEQLANVELEKEIELEELRKKSDNTIAELNLQLLNLGKEREALTDQMNDAQAKLVALELNLKGQGTESTDLDKNSHKIDGEKYGATDIDAYIAKLREFEIKIASMAGLDSIPIDALNDDKRDKKIQLFALLDRTNQYADAIHASINRKRDDDNNGSEINTTPDTKDLNMQKENSPQSLLLQKDLQTANQEINDLKNQIQELQENLNLAHEQAQNQLVERESRKSESEKCIANPVPEVREESTQNNINSSVRIPLQYRNFISFFTRRL